VMLVLLVVMAWRRKRGWKGVGVAVIAFAAVATPWIATLSSVKGRVTYGDTGKLNYAWYVVDAAIMHAQETPSHGKPAHPTRRLSTGPVIYEFAGPVPGTYPVWYDPSYWHEGIRVPLSPRLQVRRLAMSVQDLQSQSWFYPTVATLIALCLVAGRSAAQRAVRSTWFVILPVAAGFGLYALVLVLTRHIAPFFVVGLTTVAVAIAASMKWGSHEDRRGAAVIAAALAAVLTLMSVSQIVFVDRRLPEGQHLEVAVALNRHGLGGGSRIGVIGDSMHAYWAHLGRLRIVAEILPDQTVWFWSQNATKRAQQLELFRRTGAAAVIADHVPSWADKAGWAPIGESGYWVWRPRSGA